MSKELVVKNNSPGNNKDLLMNNDIIIKLCKKTTKDLFEKMLIDQKHEAPTTTPKMKGSKIKQPLPREHMSHIHSIINKHTASRRELNS